MKINPIHLFHQHMRNRHAITYALFFQAYVIASIILLIAAVLGFHGVAKWETQQNQYEALFWSLGYIFFIQFLIPYCFGTIFKKKYLFPAIYKSISKEEMQKILQRESFTCPVPSHKEFLESEKWYCFDGILVSKEMISKINVSRPTGPKAYHLGYHIVLKNGMAIHIASVEPKKCYSKEGKEPITDYILGSLKNNMKSE